jgi:hypothetical protein
MLKAQDKEIQGNACPALQPAFPQTGKHSEEDTHQRISLTLKPEGLLNFPGIFRAINPLHALPHASLVALTRMRLPTNLFVPV